MSILGGRAELLNALNSAFPVDSDLGELLSHGFNMNLAAIRRDKPAELKLYDHVVRLLEADEKIRDLVRWARQWRPDNQLLKDCEANIRLGDLTLLQETQLNDCLEQLGEDAVWDSLDQLLKSVKRVNFSILVERASEEEWGRLLAFCMVLAQQGSATVEHAAEQLFSKYEHMAFSLVPILNRPELPERFVAQCYRHAKGSWKLNVPGASETPVFVAYSILAAQQAAGEKPPLHTFCRSLAGMLDDAGKQQLDRWWNDTANRLDLLGEPPSQLGPTWIMGDRASVIVELREKNHSQPENPTWMPRAWLYEHGTDPPQRLDNEEVQREETLATMPEYLRELRERVRQRNVRVDLVLFEFFVSFDSMCHPIDQWPVPISRTIRTALGYENALVLRDLDRDSDKVNDRWQSLVDEQALVQENDGETEFTDGVVESNGVGDAESLYYQYDESPEHQCLILRVPVANAEEASKLGDLEAALAAGFPIVMWTRCSAKIDEFRRQTLQWLSHPPRELPSRVHELRRQEPKNEGHLGRHVTLFFENGDYTLPEKQLFEGARR